MSNFHAALEIGTSRTVLAIGETGDGGRLKITSHAEIVSAGVRKSQIIDINQATQSIRSVLHEIEEKQRAAGNSLTIGNAVLAISGQTICVSPYTGNAAVNSARVGENEISEVQNNAHNTFPLPKDRELLDIINQDFELDEMRGLTTPRGMSGRSLKLNTLHIHADANRINDARTAADGAHLEIRESIFATTCAADAVLEEREKREGVIVLDFGGGSTGYAIYCDSHLVDTGVIGIGGDHVTNDIAHAFQTTQRQAEDLKILEASAVPGADDVAERVKIPGSTPLMESRTISRASLNLVVNARLHELMEIILEKIEDLDLIHRLHAGVVITGGGAAMRDLDALIRHDLAMDVRTGRPLNVDGLSDVKNPASFATIAGALLYAQRNFEDKSILGNFFKGFFK